MLDEVPTFSCGLFESAEWIYELKHNGFRGVGLSRWNDRLSYDNRKKFLDTRITFRIIRLHHSNSRANSFMVFVICSSLNRADLVSDMVRLPVVE